MIWSKLINTLLKNRSMCGGPRAVVAGLVFFLVSFAPALRAQTQRVPAAIASDPAPDKENPASMATVQVPSHGAVEWDCLRGFGSGAASGGGAAAWPSRQREKSGPGASDSARGLGRFVLQLSGLLGLAGRLFVHVLDGRHTGGDCVSARSGDGEEVARGFVADCADRSQ